MLPEQEELIEAMLVERYSVPDRALNLEAFGDDQRIVRVLPACGCAFACASPLL